jgi:hypothetical protein
MERLGRPVGDGAGRIGGTSTNAAGRKAWPGLAALLCAHELKKQLRSRAPTAFRALAAVWRSPPVDYLFHAQRRQRLRWRLDRGEAELGFDISGAMGLGATLSNAVLLLGFCDRRGLRPRIRFTNPLYRIPGRRDWFGAYFRLRSEPAADPGRKVRNVKYIAIGSQADYALPGVGLDMTLARANELFHRYLAFDPPLLAEADAFAAAHGLDASSIAVHFRGTDKTRQHNREAPEVGWEALFEALRRLAGAAPRARIFFATDEPELIAHARRSELAPRLVVYECRELFFGGRPAHVTDGDGYRKGFEAIVTMLLIARCGIVVRTPSHLSAWANILNLDQKVVMLTRPLDDFMHFPDARVWRDRWEPAELARWMAQNLRFQPACHF